MDVFLPNKNGWELLNELSQHHDQVTVLALSGSFVPGADNALPIAQRQGARKILAKPFELTKFLEVVSQLLAVPSTSLYITDPPSAPHHRGLQWPKSFYTQALSSLGLGKPYGVVWGHPLSIFRLRPSIIKK